MSQKKRVLMVCLGKNTIYAFSNIQKKDFHGKPYIFVSLCNICRSPIAEAVFENEMNKRGLRNQWEVDSAAIIGYHTGKKPDHRALSTLKENGVTNYSHRARQITQEDFNKFDWIFGMDDANIQELNGLKPNECKAKVELLGSYDPSGEIIIRDPYYDSGSAGFQKAYEQCLRSITVFLNKHTS